MHVKGGGNPVRKQDTKESDAGHVLRNRRKEVLECPVLEVFVLHGKNILAVFEKLFCKYKIRILHLQHTKTKNYANIYSCDEGL